jgi:MFS family permease
MKNQRLAAILLVVFIDLLGFSLILPLLPYYADKYGASGTVTGLLVASYAVMQLIGAPILGRLSDRYGRRPILLLSVAGTSAGFFLLALADPIGRLLAGALAPSAASAFVIVVLFASRMLDGLTGGNLSVAQAYITDVTDERNRSKGLGMIGAAFGLGFIIGPAVGGLLSRWGYAVPAYAAAGLTLVNLSLIYAWLPESLSEARRAEIAAAPRAPFTLRRAIDRAAPPLQRLTADHTFLLWAGLFHAPDYLRPLCTAPLQLDGAEYRLCVDLRGSALHLRTGIPGGQVDRALPRGSTHLPGRRSDDRLPAGLGLGPFGRLVAGRLSPHLRFRRAAQHPAVVGADQSGPS